MNNWSKTTVVALLVAVAAGLSGCGGNQAAPNPSVQQRQLQDERYSAMDNGYGAAETRTDVASHLEALATSVPGVRGANCVVFGKYAIVGIDVDEKMERSTVGTLKYAVAEAFRKDPVGIDALVTADIDIAQRLREINADIRAGRPIAGFAEEMADIVGRLVPQIPRDIVPPAQPDNINNDDGARSPTR